jgi:hypothetical protein
MAKDQNLKSKEWGSHWRIKYLVNWDWKIKLEINKTSIKRSRPKIKN